ncbi:hypothetical protein R3F72_16650, partial [Salinicola sp. 4072]|uniref:hypothetical protein n=1 Tax=Salinicola sp. 4072 TaxID=3082157 RepID=UPI002FC80A2E
VLSLGERDLFHREALSDGGRKVRFYPTGADQAAVAGFMQRFLNCDGVKYKFAERYVKLLSSEHPVPDWVYKIREWIG